MPLKGWQKMNANRTEKELLECFVLNASSVLSGWISVIFKTHKTGCYTVTLWHWNCNSLWTNVRGLSTGVILLITLVYSYKPPTVLQASSRTPVTDCFSWCCGTVIPRSCCLQNSLQTEPCSREGKETKITSVGNILVFKKNPTERKRKLLYITVRKAAQSF